MGEIKKKLNIKKISVKNLFLVLLLVLVMVALGAITKLMSVMGKGKIINTADAACNTIHDAEPMSFSACTNCGCSG